MAHHFNGWINPYTNGLLGGIAAAGQEWDKYNLMNAQIEGRIKAYQAKYGAMASTQQLREQNNALMGRLKMEANQRTYSIDQTGDDGKPYKITYRNVYNPDSGHYEPQEVGRVAISGKAAGAPVTRNFGDQVKQWNPDTQTWDTVGSNVRTQDPTVAAREAARDAKIDARENQRDDRAKAERLDSAVSKDMDKFDKADASQQATMLKSAGVKLGASDSHMFGANTPNSDDEAAARAAYEQAITAKHAKALGIKAPADTTGAPDKGSAPPAAADAQHPDMTPDGRPIKYGPDGQAYIKGPDGKPVPYSPTGQNAPLAMDEQPDANSAVASASPSESGDDEQDQDQDQGGSPLLADAEQPEQTPQMGSPESDAEDEQDDNQADQMNGGLLT